MPTTATPNILQDPGYLFSAPIGTALPVNTVVGSKFTDAWAAAWVSWGATEDGSEFTYETKVEPVRVAEFFDPIRWATTDRSGSIAFNIADWTLANWKRMLNGGSLTIVSGTTTTQLNKYEPPAPGSEVRTMLGWESLGNDVRIIMYQAINGGSVKSSFKKSPAIATMAAMFNFEIPTSPTVPFSIFSAGTLRA